MASKKRLAPRKQPVQRRAEATVVAIVGAASLLLEREGLGAFNTNRVAELAGVSVGSLYQYFPHKEALLAVLIEESSRRLADEIAAAVQASRGRSLRVGVRRFVSVAVEQQFAQPRLAAALDFMERQLPVERLLADSRAVLAGSLVQFLAEHRGGIEGDLATIAVDLLTIVRALVDDAAASGGPEPANLRARVERAALGYLQPARVALSRRA